MTPLFKLTNFFSEWPEFYASLPPKTVNDSAEKLSNVFEPDGKYMGDIDEALDSVLFYFKNDKGFRKLFTGYSEAEKDAIAVFIGSDATKKSLLAKMRGAFDDFARSQGKTVDDYSYDAANGFRDDEPASARFPGYDLVPTTLCGVFYVKPASAEKDMTASEAEAAVGVLGYYTEEERNNYKQDVLLCYKDFIYQYIGEANFYMMAENQEMSFSSTGEAEAYIDANLVDQDDKPVTNANQQEIEKHKKLQRDAENKLNRLPVTKFGGAKNQNKADELAREAAYHEKTWRDLQKSSGSAAPTKTVAAASKAGVIGSPTAEAVSVRNEPFTYVGPDGKTVMITEVGGVIKPGQRCFEATNGNGTSATFIFNDNWSLDESYDEKGEDMMDEYTVEAITDRYNPKPIVDKRKELLDWRGTTKGGKAAIGSEIKEFAERKGCLPVVKKVAKWLNTLSGHGCGRGVAVGKGYSTLLIDVAYEDAALSIDTYSDTIKLKGQFCDDFKQFKAVFDKNYVVVKSIKK